MDISNLRVGDIVLVVANDYPLEKRNASHYPDGWHDLPIGSLCKVTEVNTSTYYNECLVEMLHQKHSQYLLDFHIEKPEAAKNTTLTWLLETTY